MNKYLTGAATFDRNPQEKAQHFMQSRQAETKFNERTGTEFNKMMESPVKVSRKNAQTAGPTPRLNNFLSSGFLPIETHHTEYVD